MSTQHGPEKTERDNSVAPEILLLVLLSCVAWVVGLCSVGYALGWPWMLVYFGVSVAGLFLWGHVDNTTTPEERHRADRNRRLAELDDAIERAGGVRNTADGQTPPEIQKLLARKARVYSDFPSDPPADQRAAAWRSQPISAPRRVVRRISRVVLLVLLIPLALFWHGSILIGLPVFVGWALYPKIGVWALLPAALMVPLGIWTVRRWTRRGAP